MTFPTPPRGSGRHWRDDTPPASPTVRRRYLRDDDEGAGDYPTDPTMTAPLNRVPPPDVYRQSGPASRYQDLVVPRVFVEPDEVMDRLRQRAFRWGIARDVVAVAIGLYLLGSWLLPPLWRAVGG